MQEQLDRRTVGLGAGRARRAARGHRRPRSSPTSTKAPGARYELCPVPRPRTPWPPPGRRRLADVTAPALVVSGGAGPVHRARFRNRWQDSARQRPHRRRRALALDRRPDLVARLCGLGSPRSRGPRGARRRAWPCCGGVPTPLRRPGRGDLPRRPVLGRRLPALGTTAATCPAITCSPTRCSTRRRAARCCPRACSASWPPSRPWSRSSNSSRAYGERAWIAGVWFAVAAGANLFAGRIPLHVRHGHRAVGARWPGSASAACSRWCWHC